MSPKFFFFQFWNREYCNIWGVWTYIVCQRSRELPWFSQSNGSCTLDVKRCYREAFPSQIQLLWVPTCQQGAWACSGEPAQTACKDWSCSGEQMEVPLVDQADEKLKKQKGCIGLAWITDREPFEKPHGIPPGFPPSQSDVNLLQILSQLVRATQMPQSHCSLPSSTRYPSLGKWIDLPSWVSQPCTDSLSNARSHCDSRVIQLEKQFWDHPRFPSRSLSRPRSAWGD